MILASFTSEICIETVSDRGYNENIKMCSSLLISKGHYRNKSPHITVH